VIPARLSGKHSSATPVWNMEKVRDPLEIRRLQADGQDTATKHAPRVAPIPPMSARWMDTSINPKRIAFQSLKRLGIDVRRSRKHPTLIDFIENRGVKVVYDVGANVGQFGTGLRERGYGGKIISFEPVKSAFDALKSVAATDGNWDVLQCAIGSEPGEVWVNVSVNTQFSSIKSLSEKAASVDPESGIVGREKVACKTLDEVAASQGPTLIRSTRKGLSARF
jgi:FkbM family methyltransferase